MKLPNILAGMWDLISKKLLNESCHFGDTEKFNWEPVLLENRRCLCVSITVCDNPGKYALDTLQFVHVDAGQTSEDSSQSDCSPSY